MRTVRSHFGRTTVAAFAVALAIAASPAEAQFGYGYGHGFGGYGAGFGFGNRDQSVNYLNQRSLLQASRATMGPVQHNVYANNPNAYVNHMHDAGYLDKYDVGTRRTIEASIGRYSDGPPPGRVSQPSTAVASATPPAAPRIALSGFFDRYQKLVWPEEAPTYGLLGAQRSQADLASLAVLNEYNLQGLAQLSTVTEARSKLLDYGRPALEHLRESSTPRIADGFHLFLLSLYESLAQAATIPKPAAATPAQP